MDILRGTDGMNIKSLLSVLFKSKCRIHHTRNDMATVKLNERLKKVEDHIRQRATVDGEDEWFLTLQRHSENGGCKT